MGRLLLKAFIIGVLFQGMYAPLRAIAGLDLDGPLMELQNRMLCAVKAVPDPYYEAQVYLTAHPTAELAPDQILWPQDLIRQRVEEPYRLTKQQLSPDHDAFSLILGLLELFGSLPELAKEVPNLCKVRQAYERYYGDFITGDSRKREALLERPVRLVLPGRKGYLITREMAYTLRGKDEYNNAIGRSVGGSHKVMALQGLYFKTLEGLTDVNPLMEQAVYGFNGLLLNDAALIAPSLAFQLEEVPVSKAVCDDERLANRSLTPDTRGEALKNPKLQYKRVFIKQTLQVGAEVKGKLLKDTPPKAMISNYSYQAQLLCSYLTRAVDYHEGNFIRKTDGTIVGIDNDMAFEPLYRKTSDDSYALRLTNSLLWRAEWDQPVDEDLKQKLRTLEPEAFLVRWLARVNISNEAYRGLINPLKVSRTMVDELLKSLHHVKGKAAGCGVLTFKHLMKHVDPVFFHIIESARGACIHLPEKDRLSSSSLKQIGVLEDEIDVGEEVPRYEVVRTLVEGLAAKPYHDFVEVGTLARQLLGDETVLRVVAKNIANDEEGKSILGLLVNGGGISKEKRETCIRELLTRVLEGENFPQTLDLLYAHGIRFRDETVLIHAESSLRQQPYYKEYRPLFDQLERSHHQLKFHRMLEMLFPKTEVSSGKGNSAILLKGAIIDEQGQVKICMRSIPREIYCQLFHENGKFKARNVDQEGTQQGRRQVGYVEKNGYRLYVKLLPELPGIEQQVGTLSHKLFGRGTPQTCLFRIQGGELTDMPVLVSEGIMGDTLREVTHSRPELLSKLAMDQFTEQVLLAVITNPEDGNKGNYVVSQEGDAYHITPVDNDRSFVPDVDRTLQSQMGRDKIRVQVRTALFCLDQMNHPLDAEVLKEFRSFNFADFLKSWLDEMDKVQQCYDHLYSEGPLLHQLWKDHKVMIGTPYRKGGIVQLYTKLMGIHDYLAEVEGRPLTGFDLVGRVSPYLEKRYKTEFKKYLLLTERFHAVESGIDASVSQTTQVLFAQGIPIHEDHWEANTGEKSRSPLQAKEDLSDAINKWQLIISQKKKTKNLKKWVIRSTGGLAGLSGIGLWFLNNYSRSLIAGAKEGIYGECARVMAENLYKEGIISAKRLALQIYMCK